MEAGLQPSATAPWKSPGGTFRETASVHVAERGWRGEPEPWRSLGAWPLLGGNVKSQKSEAAGVRDAETGPGGGGQRARALRWGGRGAANAGRTPGPVPRPPSLSQAPLPWRGALKPFLGSPTCWPQHNPEGLAGPTWSWGTQEELTAPAGPSPWLLGAAPGPSAPSPL